MTRPQPAETLPPELRALLRFAQRTAGWHEDRIAAGVREAFGCTLLRYHQRLFWAMRHPAAEAAEPATVHRLQRLIARRQHRPSPAADHPRGA